MIRKIVLIVALSIGVAGFGQDDGVSKADEDKMEKGVLMLSDSVIEMDVDEDVYSITQGNSYFTSDQKSAIIGMVVPSSYKKMKEDMGNQEAREGVEIIDRGELIENGKKVLYMKHKLEREGEVYIMLIYCKENNEESSIVITSYFEVDKEDEYIGVIKKAIFSAKVE